MVLRWHASRNEAPLKHVQFQLFFGGIFLGYKLELGVCGRLRNGSYKNLQFQDRGFLAKHHGEKFRVRNCSCEGNGC